MDPLHLRPEDQSADFHHLSPKLGLTYRGSNSVNGYAAYRHAFRVPSAGQLFRSGSTVDSEDLDPVKVDSFDIGLRGQLGTRMSFDTSVYYMTKEDAILSVLDTLTGARHNSNAGDKPSVYVEPSTGALASLITTADRWEGWSFSNLHKWRFFDPLSKDLRDGLLLVTTVAITLVSVTGLWQLARRRR